MRIYLVTVQQGKNDFSLLLNVFSYCLEFAGNEQLTSSDERANLSR